MKISIKQYQIMLLSAVVIMLLLAFLHFGYDDLKLASLEDEDRLLWDIEPETYETREDGTEHIVIKVTFNNVKLFEDYDGTPTECTYFDFSFMPSGGNLEYKRISSPGNVAFGESFEIIYDSVMTPAKSTYGLSSSMEIRVLAFDEKGGLINDDTSKTISLSRSEQPVIERTTPEEETPGFEAVLAIAGLLAVAYLIKRQ